MDKYKKIAEIPYWSENIYEFKTRNTVNSKRLGHYYQQVASGEHESFCYSFDYDVGYSDSMSMGRFRDTFSLISSAFVF